MKNTLYISIEGTEGVYKTTNVDMLTEALTQRGKSVLKTKEPGTPHLPLTLELRKLMLDKQYESAMTRPARELLSQAIRSIHLDKLVGPALGKVDFIIQDRGLLSGFAYGQACGNTTRELEHLTRMVMDSATQVVDWRLQNSTLKTTAEWNIYDIVFVLKGDTEAGLKRAAAAKQEFTAGDVIESRGLTFMNRVEENFKRLYAEHDNVYEIQVTGKTREQLVAEMLNVISLYESALQ